MSEWACPRCPVCGAPPLIEFVLPFFCADDGCRVMSWNPAQTREELREELADDKWRKIDLTGLLRAEDVDAAGPDQQPGDDQGGAPGPGAPGKLDDPGEDENHRD